jgi:hypothetical protein
MSGNFNESWEAHEASYHDDGGEELDPLDFANETTARPRCVDGMCGALDCARCYPTYEPKEEE